MAAIDKFYITSWDQYAEIRDFFEKCGEVTDDYGNKFIPLNYLWEISEEEFNTRINNQLISQQEHYNNGDYDYMVRDGYWTQEEYDNFKPKADIPIMNTPIIFDIWMIRNCQHIKWLTKDLMNKYGGDHSGYSYPDILTRTSVWDTFKRNGLGKNIKVKLPKINVTYSHLGIEVSLSDNIWALYSEDDDVWYFNREPRLLGYVSSMAYIFGSVKSIYRKLQKWNLPENAKVKISVVSFKNGDYVVSNYETIIKKK